MTEWGQLSSPRVGPFAAALWVFRRQGRVYWTWFDPVRGYIEYWYRCGWIFQSSDSEVRRGGTLRLNNRCGQVYRTTVDPIRSYSRYWDSLGWTLIAVEPKLQQTFPGFGRHDDALAQGVRAVVLCLRRLRHGRWFVDSS